MHQSWKDLAEKYAESADLHADFKQSHSAMAGLCNYINTTHMRNGLFGHTSMHKLSISQIPIVWPPHPKTPWLQIEPLAESKIEFRYTDTKIKERQWTRVIEAQLAIEAFKRFVDQLGWSTSPLP